MHYNIKKLIDQYDKNPKGNTDIIASDIQQLYDIAKNENVMKNVIWHAIINSWKAGYSAGYNKAKKENKTRKEGVAK